MNRVRVELCVLAMVFSVWLVAAAPNPQPDPTSVYSSNVQRIEHLGLRMDTTRCVRADWGTVPDGGPLLTALKSVGGGDGSVANYPDPDLNYVCTASANDACWRQGAAATTCQFAARLYNGIPTAPFMFLAEDAGGPVVRGITASGSVTSVECCPVVPVITKGR